MKVKIALLADLHLSDVEHTPQDEAFLWAVEELKRIKPDACVFLGDITACGSQDAALHFRQVINELPCPCVVVPGNSDIRTKTVVPMMERILLNYPKGLKVGNIHIVGVNTSHDRIFPEERARLSALKTEGDILLCSHQPAKYLDADSLAFIREWICDRKSHGQKVLMWASGHRHVFEEGSFEGTPTLSVRALDLDKCTGGSAQICIFEQEGDGEPTVDEIVYTGALTSEWSDEERRELVDYLGITCYNRTKLERDMPFAIKNGVRHLEWRSINDGDLELIEQWRRAGGQSFSLHFSSVGYEDGVTGIDRFRSYAMDAVRANADMVTVHPPHIANENMQLTSPAYFEIANAVAEALLPVAEAGIDILIENNHTDLRTPDDPMKCAYGCTPIDITGWRDALNERLGAKYCHLRLDVGHARNNMPLSQYYPIGKWYAQVGRDAHSYHLHQTIYDKAEARMRNHYPITGLHDGFVAFDGFLWAWRTGVLRHGPVILEIREGEGAPATWQRLKELLS